ncbi:enoyl-CoA hydratase-related protein [Georgenia sp. SYP-B2076]|uniref:enoyl-CoA hydratase-related protein n=1 Tax=Georgenia sp. SYP-B2076 TaxID=2495881 RepID=UPI0013E09187|nr:enoyl-CoA hydratase-related protein [Georgenia sp. SYP-B2076]
MSSVEIVDVTGVRIVTLARPEKLNAFDHKLVREYLDALEAAAGDPSVRAIVVTGQGRAFSVGGDMAALADLSRHGADAGADDPRGHLVAMSLSKPVIAAVNGYCLGLGLVHALACDIRFAAAGATLSAMFSRRGLVAEQGLAWLVPHIAGRAVALDLLLSGRTITAVEALEMGLVHRVVSDEDLLDEALAYAKDLVDNVSPASMRVIKQQVNLHPGMSRDDAVEHSAQQMLDSFAWPDFAEGVASFQDKRRPRFEPLQPEP